MATVDVVQAHAGRWSAATGVATVAGAATLIALELSGRRLPGDSADVLLTSLVTVVAYGVAGAVLIDRRPDLPFGWLLAGTAATQAVAAPAAVLAFDAWQGGETGPLVRIGATGSALLFLPVAAQGLINVRFPSGDPTTRGARLLERAIATGTVAAVLGGAVVALAVAGEAPEESPDSFMSDRLGGTALGRLGGALQVFVPVVILLGLVAGIGVVLRWRRALGRYKRQLAWRAAGVVAALLLFPFAVAEVTPSWLDAADPLLFVITLAVPVVRHHLWAIDTLVRRSVVYGSVTVALAIGYLALTALGTAVVSERVSASVAAGVIALSFAPVRRRAQSVVDRVAYGDRSDPYRTLRDLDRQLAEIAAPGKVLPAVVETIGFSLRLPYVAIERPDGSLIAVHGEPVGREERWPLAHEGVEKGTLVASPRRGEEEFHVRDRELLSDLARHAGMAVHAEMLTADLVASRQRLVTAREEERRRLRRDLHDGLGPTLTGIGLNLDAARSQVRADPDATERLIRDAKAATSAAISDVRRLVYGLRPPSLDNLGFVGAIRRQTEQLSTNGCRVTLDASSLPDLPAAIEVAAYRTVIEAITNAIRHGQARRCDVRIEVRPDRLEILVEDDGSSSGAWTPGVGLLSMREQAEQLGGSVEAGPLDSGGSRVAARYPIALVDG